MSNRLNGKVAVVTGGSTGIGRAVAARLATEGANVVITGRNEDTLKESAAQHGNIEYKVADVAKSDDVKRVIDETVQKHGKIDVLVNNAGIAWFAPLGQIDANHIGAQFATNVSGLIDTTQQALPHLIAVKGVIINIASSVVDSPMPGGSVYSSTKAAVVTLSRAWSRELAAQGVRVNIVSPGPIETPIFAKTGMTEEQLKEMAGQIVQNVPLGRFGRPEDIAASVAYLASDDAAFVTGEQLRVDGGYAA